MAGLPRRLFMPYGVDARGPSVVCESVDVSSPVTLHFSHITDYVYEFFPLPDPDVALSVLVCDVEHTSFHFANSTVFVGHTVPTLLP